MNSSGQSHLVSYSLTKSRKRCLAAYLNIYYFICNSLHEIQTICAIHENVYHLFNKVPDLCAFFSQLTPSYNIFGITVTTRLQNVWAGDHISNYCISKKKITFSCYWTDWYCRVHTQLCCKHYTKASRPWRFINIGLNWNQVWTPLIFFFPTRCFFLMNGLTTL